MQPDRRQVIKGVINGAMLALGVSPASPARAQSRWPGRQVRLVVPYLAGGGTDFFARVVSGVMEKELGQPFIVENRPGAATIIGADVVAHAPADGYTLLLGDTATFAANKSLYQKLPYDPQKDFAPVSLTGRFVIVLLVNTNKLNVSSVAELIEAAKRAPGTIDYGSPGVGSPFHLATELLARSAGVKFNHVPYRGFSAAVQDFTAGVIGMMFIDFASARAQLELPHIKAIAVASPEESPRLPGVPTVASAGFPGFEAWAWQGIAAPAGTAPDIIERGNASYRSAAKNPEIVAKLNGAGIEVLQSTPGEFADYMRSEIEKWGAVIKEANIKAD